MRLTPRSLEQWAPLAIWAAGIAYAGLLISRQSISPPQFGLVFNNMLAHMARGRFDVDPDVILNEAFVYKDRAYAYFGVFCALLRLPLLATGHLNVNITRISLFVAAAVSLGFRLGALQLAMARAPGLSKPFRLLLLIAVALGGESVQFLRPSLYQEVVSWAAALAAGFVYLALRRLLAPHGPAAKTYAGLAVTAGLALLCRFSTGVGLSAAFAAMLGVEAWRARGRLQALRPFAPAALILALFVGAAGGVNYARWEDPLAFMPMQYEAAMRQIFPDRGPRLDAHGALNVRRLPFALQYYFAPIWILQDSQGRLLFQTFQAELFEDVELPPGSLLLSDPVIVILAGVGVWTLARRPTRLPDPALAGAALLGLCIPAGLMLLAITLTFRYRMEFYPPLDLAAALGLIGLGQGARAPSWRMILYPGIAGAGVAFASLVIYYLSPFGAATDLDMRHGWTTPIVDELHGRNPEIGHLTPDGRRIPPRGDWALKTYPFKK